MALASDLLQELSGVGIDRSGGREDAQKGRGPLHEVPADAGERCGQRSGVCFVAGRLDIRAIAEGDGLVVTASRGFPAEMVQKMRCPGCSPAYYMGRPARLWITAMRPQEMDRPYAASGCMSGTS